MRSLFRLFTWRHQRRHLLRAVLGLASITLGVALYVSVGVAQSTTVRAFEQTAARMAGKAELRVSRGRSAGIELAALERIEAVPGVTAAPVLRRCTGFPDLQSGPVMVLGVDFRREARFREFSLGASQINPFLLNDRGLLLTRSFAARHGLAVGRSLRIQSPAGLRTMRVAGLVDDAGAARALDGNLAVMPLAAAMELFATGGRVDAIDVFPASAAGALQASLGPDFRVAPAVEGGSAIMEEVLTRVRALVIVGVVALMVGLFIIYLSVSIGVVERTKEIGTLRALGGSRGQVLALFLGEAGVLGLVGSALGVALGFGLAKVLVLYTAENINIQSLQIHVSEMVLPAGRVVAALIIGTAVSLLAALVPALRATGIPPIEALRPVRYGADRAGSQRLGFWVGAALLVVSTLGVTKFYLLLPPIVGILTTVAVLLATALVLPQITVWASLLMRRPLRALFRIEGYLASDNVMKYPQRTALTVIALGGALSIMVTSASVFLSFERFGTRWIENGFPWDLSVQPTDIREGFASDVRLPADVVERVKRVEGVESAFALQTALQEAGRYDAMLLAADLRGYLEMLKAAGSEWPDFRLDSPAVQEVMRGEAVGVSSNFLKLQGLRVGDRVELRTPKGPRTYRIAYHREDLTWPQGLIVIDLSLYRELWGDSSVRYIDLRVKPGHDPEAVRAALGKELAGEFQVFVYSKAQIRGIASDMMAQSFKLTQVQGVIAMIIGFLGIVNTVLISVLRRTREIGLLRALGMTRAQVARTVVIESVFVAFVGGLVGVAAGLVGAAFPISAQVLRTTGFELEFAMPWGTAAAALAGSIALGFAAAWLPARRAAGLNVLEAISYE